VNDPSVNVIRHRSELGWWEMALRAPHPRLAGQVLRYAGYIERTNAPLRRLEPAFSGVVLILSFGEPIRLLDADGREQTHTSFTGGLSDGPTFTEHAGRQHGIQIDLAPPAARALLGVPLRELTNRVVALDDLLGRRAGELTEQLWEAPNWQSRFALLDGALGRRLAAEPMSAPPAAVVGAWQRLRESRGRAEIGELALELGYSRGRLSARFAEELGLAPKAFARVLRFERAVALLSRDDGARFAEIAHECGYYDQAHLNRDFREFAGTSPGDYVGWLLPDGGGVSAGEEVPFVQDTAQTAG
jgi:AraC-like DNA-binding protein